AILMQRPIFAIGEALAPGLITLDNLSEAMSSNFGDIGPNDLDIDFSALSQRITDALQSNGPEPELIEQVKAQYDLQAVAHQLELDYQSVYVYKHRREMPIIMYHRFIKDDSEKGVHGTYMHVDMLEKHFKLLKRLGYETLTFS